MHMAQLMPLPLIVSCFSKIQIGFTFLVPAHLGIPGKRAVKWVCVFVAALVLKESLGITVTCLYRQGAFPSFYPVDIIKSVGKLPTTEKQLVSFLLDLPSERIFCSPLLLPIICSQFLYTTAVCQFCAASTGSLCSDASELTAWLLVFGHNRPGFGYPPKNWQLPKTNCRWYSFVQVLLVRS